MSVDTEKNMLTYSHTIKYYLKTKMVSFTWISHCECQSCNSYIHFIDLYKSCVLAYILLSMCDVYLILTAAYGDTAAGVTIEDKLTFTSLWTVYGSYITHSHWGGIGYEWNYF